MPVIDTTKDLDALFRLQVKATPELVALEDEKCTLTYAELDHRVGVLAAQLRKHGVTRDSLVGVLMGRSADYVVSCLAALRAGGAFLVLELAYPAVLLADVIADAAPKVIVTHTEHVAQLKADIPLIVLDDKLSDSSEEEYDGDAGLELDLERLAFVSYSSGTTGRPKGIANPHRAPVRSYDLRFALSDLRPGDRVACNVFFIWEILRPLLRGATVVTVPDEVSYDPVALVELFRSKKITETLMTPTLLATILGRHAQLGSRLPDLRTLWLNGEVVTVDLAQRALKALPNVRLLNCYSASETHEIACGDIREMFDSSTSVVPVGPPMDPDHTYILDEQGKPVEPGGNGELVIGGSLLAREYLNLPETTAKAFLPDAFDSTPGAKMYKTGDTARMLPSGIIEITGRVGTMIKIRGYSVWPGAVENAIVTRLSVSHCAVIASGEGLDRKLIAYFVPDDEVTVDRPKVAIDDHGLSPSARRILSAHLAHYMIPTLWIELDQLPTHQVSGKVDLKALPPPSKAASQANTETKKHDANQKISLEDIAKKWSLVLNIPYRAIIQEEHDFFDLGGHSLALVNLVTRLTGDYGFPVPIARLAGNPSLKGHLEVILDARDGHTAAVQADLPQVLKRDSALPEDIVPKSMSMKRLCDADTVLLTGTTGFLGAFILRALLAQTSARIICLVRFADIASDKKAAGLARIRGNMLDLGIWDDSIIDRLEIVPANLARAQFGLSPDAFDELAAHVDVIIHSAATVNLVYPYAAMQGANVIGTKEILRLACRAGATLHHISTNGVLPKSVAGWNEDYTVPLADVPNQIVDGYGQTKWVAEQLVIEAANRGLAARIYRPGTISGHSFSGSTNTYDLFNALLVESLQLGYAPAVEGWYAEMTPVNFVSDSIVALANLETDQRIFHLGDPNPVTSDFVFDVCRELGYLTKPLEWEEWTAFWSENRGKANDNIFTVEILRRGMPNIESLQGVTVLKDPITSVLLEKSGLIRPKIDKALLKTYLRHFSARGWLPYRSQPGILKTGTIKGPLSGRVAVVTGASSGIGAAVAFALAREGARVVIAARRKAALESLKTKISSIGGFSIVQETDVTDSSQVDKLMHHTRELLGPIDILVACAGVMYYTMFANSHVEEWNRTVDVNCKGLLNCLAATVPDMLARNNGHIVAISSDAGRKVFPGLGAYSASKFFVEATLQSLRLETAGKGLRVTSVQPGNTDTGLVDMSTDPEAIKKYGEPTGAKVLEPEDVAASIVHALLQPEHVAVNEILIEPRDEPI